MSDDGGQLMMLAGIVLTISFILTALTLTQVTALEREAAARGPMAIVAEWRFLHERLGSNLNVAIGPETTNVSLREAILPTVQATFRSAEGEKGYDLVIRLASDATYAATGDEDDLFNLAGTHYDAWTWDDSVHFSHEVWPRPADPPGTPPGRQDGILWQIPCPDSGGPQYGCIGGVYVYVRMTDGSVTMEESILFATNRP